MSHTLVTSFDASMHLICKQTFSLKMTAISVCTLVIGYVSFSLLLKLFCMYLFLLCVRKVCLFLTHTISNEKHHQENHR